MSKNNLKNKICNVCHTDKPINLFRKKKEELGGGYYAVCMECTEKIKASKMRQKMSVVAAPDIDMSQPVDLKKFLERGSISDSEIKRILLTVLTYTNDPHFMLHKDIYKKFFPNRSPIRCAEIVKEFDEAARNGLSFDEELKTRKYRKDGKRVLIKGAK